MRANQADGQDQKLTYVKPKLATHGSVQQLTEGGIHHDKVDCGSNISIKPTPFGGKGGIFSGW